MAIIKKFKSFVSERIEESSAVAVVTPKITKIKKTISDEVSPEYAGQKVIDRFESIYHKSTKEEKEEINSYFEK